MLFGYILSIAVGTGITLGCLYLSCICVYVLNYEKLCCIKDADEQREV